MGMLDNIRNFFRKSNDDFMLQEDDSYKKSALATQIVNSVDKIKRINSFDSSIWNLSNVTTYDLERRSLAELEKIQASLNNRIAQLTMEGQKRNPQRESLEASKWTGQKPRNMSNHDFDRLQRDDR